MIKVALVENDTNDVPTIKHIPTAIARIVFHMARSVDKPYKCPPNRPSAISNAIIEPFTWPGIIYLNPMDIVKSGAANVLRKCKCVGIPYMSPIVSLTSQTNSRSWHRTNVHCGRFADVGFYGNPDN